MFVPAQPARASSAAQVKAKRFIISFIYPPIRLRQLCPPGADAAINEQSVHNDSRRFCGFLARCPTSNLVSVAFRPQYRGTLGGRRHAAEIALRSAPAPGEGTKPRGDPLNLIRLAPAEGWCS